MKVFSSSSVLKLLTPCYSKSTLHTSPTPLIFANFHWWITVGKLAMKERKEMQIFAETPCFLFLLSDPSCFFFFSSIVFFTVLTSERWKMSICSFTAFCLLSFQNAAKCQNLLVHICNWIFFMTDHVCHTGIFFFLPCVSEQLVKVLLQHAA